MATVEVSPPLTRSVSESRFRDVIGRFASGVAVVTTHADDRDHGTTVSALSSVSADPPMLLVCLNKASNTGQAVGKAGRFMANVLSSAQADLAKRFAVKGPDKFAGVPVSRTPSGLPYLADALALLECVVVDQVAAGTHWVFIADVVAVGATDGRPLTYYRGKFGGFHQRPPADGTAPSLSFATDPNMDLW